MSDVVDGSMTLDVTSSSGSVIADQSSDAALDASGSVLTDDAVSAGAAVLDDDGKKNTAHRVQAGPSVDDAFSQLAFTEERRKGARRAMRLSLLHRLPSIEAEFRAEFGPSSDEFSAVRRFCDAVSKMIEAVSAADED